MTRLLTKALLSGLVGLVIGPLLGVIAVFGLMLFDPKCGSPGDSGGCAMGIPAMAIGTAVLCAAAGAVLAVVRTARRR